MSLGDYFLLGSGGQVGEGQIMTVSLTTAFHLSLSKPFTTTKSLPTSLLGPLL